MNSQSSRPIQSAAVPGWHHLASLCILAMTSSEPDPASSTLCSLIWTNPNSTPSPNPWVWILGCPSRMERDFLSFWPSPSLASDPHRISKLDSESSLPSNGSHRLKSLVRFLPEIGGEWGVCLVNTPTSTPNALPLPSQEHRLTEMECTQDQLRDTLHSLQLLSKTPGSRSQLPPPKAPCVNGAELSMGTWVSHSTPHGLKAKRASALHGHYWGQSGILWGCPVNLHLSKILPLQMINQRSFLVLHLSQILTWFEASQRWK